MLRARLAPDPADDPFPISADGLESEFYDHRASGWLDHGTFPEAGPSLSTSDPTPPAAEAEAFRPPRQERSRKTLARIVRATVELLAERGVEGTTVQEVVDRAGSSVGSFYARFSGKEELLRYVEEQLWQEARERWDAALSARAWDGLPLQRVVQAAVGVLVETARAGALERRALGTLDGGAARAGAFQDHVRQTVGALLLGHRGWITHPDPDLAVDLGLRAVIGAVRELGAAADDPRLVPELGRLYMAYLGVGPSELPASSEKVEFFDIWA